LLESKLLSRRDFIGSALAGSAALAQPDAKAPDYTIEIAPYSHQLGPRTKIETVAYNSQVPGPLLRLHEGRPVTIEVRNKTKVDEVVHWHGLFLPSNVDGAMEEGTPLIAPGATARYTFTPRPSGFRWYHTHTSADRDFKKGQYTGQHGFLFIEPRQNPGQYDAEFFLALHDWKGQLLASDDGSMNVFYDVSTMNGHMLGFGEPLRVKTGQRILLHILNSSATDVHWIALPGHQFQVVALDGNAVPKPCPVPMLRLAPAERVSAVVEANNPGIWILGEVRKHIQAAGMGIVIEYAGQSGPARWQQPETLSWDYGLFQRADSPPPKVDAIEVPLVFQSKFTGHGDMDHWMINGKSFPHTDTVVLREGQRYRLLLKNESVDAHPIHLHRHVFELCQQPGGPSHGILKDTVLVEPKSRMDVEFTADDPGLTLFHCHQQDHMDMGFMMLLRYA
jgi:FtsP/CotA-like multicopper oxidase with cupredoxin domain